MTSVAFWALTARVYALQFRIKAIQKNVNRVLLANAGVSEDLEAINLILVLERILNIAQLDRNRREEVGTLSREHIHNTDAALSDGALACPLAIGSY